MSILSTDHKPRNRRCLFVSSQSLIYEIEMLSVSAFIRAIKWEKLNKRIYARHIPEESETNLETLFFPSFSPDVHDKTNLKNDFE